MKLNDWSHLLSYSPNSRRLNVTNGSDFVLKNQRKKVCNKVTWYLIRDPLLGEDRPLLTLLELPREKVDYRYWEIKSIGSPYPSRKVVMGIKQIDSCNEVFFGGFHTRWKDSANLKTKYSDRRRQLYPKVGTVLVKDHKEV